MTTTSTVSTQFEVSAELDHPRRPELTTPGWSENYMLIGNDPATGVAFFAHLGRMVPDPTVWEGILAIFLPNGEVLHSRSMGQSIGEPATAQLAFDCIEPNRRWRIRFDGVAQRFPGAQAHVRPVVSDPWEPVKFEVDFDGAHPTWNMGGEMPNQGWGNAHLEQAGYYTGTVRVGADSTAVRFHGVRDHTVGPRDYSRIIGEWWTPCIFPSGKVVLPMQFWETGDGPRLSEVAVYDGQRMHHGTDLCSHGLHDGVGTTAPPDAFEVTFAGPDGPTTLRGSGTASMVWTLLKPTGMLPGFAPTGPDDIIYVQGPARYELAGEVGYGTVERCFRARDFGTR